MSVSFWFDVMDDDVEGVHTVLAHGELDLAEAHRFRDALVELAGSAVVVDMSNVSFIDSIGVSALLGARSVIVASGNQFEIRGANRTLRRMIELTGVSFLLTD